MTLAPTATAPGAPTSEYQRSQRRYPGGLCGFILSNGDMLEVRAAGNGATCGVSGSQRFSINARKNRVGETPKIRVSNANSR